ncbi:LysR family transcriptional regulator [Microbacterium sp. LRZ72]|uniref:LysR family transcriptional regulator n=1 Tax=Microbacterium sp. LRZ72 TaxID=2942481 RepID=UPI0029A90B7A|nr:LysR family transcriptional regulator [Microbacterium sp. LRZ72]MDX2377551.1 LysR family transcriptional regulator [Microbacterium sp. LRZ72]
MAEVRYTLRQLQYFMSTAEHGTVSAAAIALHVSDSTLSSSLTALERALGTKLLVRQQARGTSLSAAGRALVPVLAPLLRQIEELPRVLHSPSRLHGVVRVGASAALAPRVIAQLLQAVEQDHPGISIDIRQEGAEALFRMVRAGELDLAFSGSRVPTDFRSVELFDQEIHVLLPAEHRLSGRERVDIQELADEPLVLLDSSPALENSLSMLLAAGIRPIIRYRTPNFELVRSMVAQGLGYSLQAVRPWGDHSYENRPLAVVPLAGNPQTHPVVLLWSAQSSPGPATEAVVDLARAAFCDDHSPR